ncbi:MAG: carboxypeptidase regulatory-like domain-containing protein [Acidobacteriota bacterium]
MTRRPFARLAVALALLMLPAAARAAAVTGRVLDSAGAPVAGAKVVWEANRSDEETLVDETLGTSPAGIGETVTDAEGRFKVALDKPGVEVAIRVLPGALPGALLGGPYDSSEDVALGDVELTAAEKVSGRVTDDAGKPVAGAKVRAYGGLPFEDEDVTLYAEATTGADGSFSMVNAPASAGRVTARANGYSPATQTSFRERVTAGKLTLRTGGSVTGTVLDPAGKPVEGAVVVTGTLAAKTDASGAYRLAGVPVGAQAVEAFSKDLAARNDSVRVKKGETSQVPLRLARSAAVTGTVVDEKSRRPIAGVRVSTASVGFSLRGAEPGRRARTDAKGKFRLVGLRPRAYSIRAAKADYLPVSMPGVVAGVSAPGTVAIALQKSAGIAGRVTDEAGAPVPGARVQIARDSGMRALMRGGPAAFLGRGGVTSGPDGAFRLRGLTAQRNVTLEAAKAGYVPAKRYGVTVKTGESVKDVALVVKRGLEARGRVVDSAGKGIAGAELRVSRPESGGGMGRVMIQMAGMSREKPDASSGADGGFRIAALEPGEYALAVSREGYASKSVPSVAVKAEGLSEWAPVVLTPGVAIGGFVRNGKGEAIVGAEVLSLGEGSGPRQATSDPEGRFRLDGLSPDRGVMLNVRADGYAPLQRTVTPPSDDLSLVLKTAGTIRGRVEDASTNRPITDFTASVREPRGGGMGGMRVFMGGRQPDKSFQSPDGTFELTDVAPGRWSVSASSPGYRPSEVTGVDVAEGETKEGVVLPLKKGAVLSGRVLDPRKGTGVPNASVSWSEESGGPGMAILAGFGGGQNAQTTDADGRFRFDGLAAGKINLTARHSDFLDASKPVEVKEDDETAVDLTLSIGGSLAGTVVAKDGRTPVAGAEVELDDQGSNRFGGSDSARADGSGNFLFEHLKAGRYRVTARSRAGSSTPKDVVLAESQRLDGVLLEMASGALVRGTVSGLPADRRGAVRIFGSGRDYEDATVTDDEGRFTLKDVPPGVLRVSASTAFPSGRSASKSVDVAEGAGEVPIEIVFDGASRLSGRVTRGERPLSGVFVMAMPDPPGSAGGRASGQTDESGQYALEGLTDGSYQVTLSGQGVSYRKPFTVSGETDGDIALPAVSISGVVTEAGSSEPLEGASVQVESGRETTLAIKRAVTDSRGFYSIEDVDAGNYQLTARKERYELKTQPVSVGSSGVEVNVALARGAGVSIRAVDGLTGLPLRDLYVNAFSSTGTVAFSGGVSLDSEGDGEISSLAPGSYSVSLFSGGYAPRTLPALAVPSPKLNLALTPGGRVEVRSESTVSGRVVDANGAPYPVGGWRRDGGVTVNAPASLWEHVAPGSYRLIVSGPSGESTYPFTVSEGATAPVQIR